MDIVLRTVAPLHAKKHNVQMSNLNSNGTFGFTITNEPSDKTRYWCSKIYADICKHLFDLSRLYADAILLVQ